MFKILDSYISYKDCVDYFLPHLEEKGSDGLIEASGGTEQDAPMDERVGAVVRSVRELHLPRYSYKEHFQLFTKFVKDNNIPEAPEGTTWIGVFYFGELDETCKGDPDKYDGQEFYPKWGDMVFFTPDCNYEPGTLTEGELPKLVAFWGDR